MTQFKAYAVDTIYNAIEYTSEILNMSKTENDEKSNNDVNDKSEPASTWFPFYSEVKKQNEDTDTTHASSTAYSDNFQTLEKLRQKLQETLLKTAARNRSRSRLSIFDLNELPYISQMRSMLLIVCASTFIIAPISYMPLATIQAAFDQKCFLYTRIQLRQQITGQGNESRQEILAMDTVGTEWGSTSICDLTTFIPVAMSILSVFVGMSTFTMWPTMMSVGRGGALMMAYAFLTILSLIACSLSVAFLYDGYNDTCDKLKEATITLRTTGYSCTFLNNHDVIIKELQNNRFTNNVHRTMMVAQIIGWCLVGLMVSKMLICVLTFLIIWFYLNSR